MDHHHRIKSLHWSSREVNLQVGGNQQGSRVLLSNWFLAANEFLTEEELERAGANVNNVRRSPTCCARAETSPPLYKTQLSSSKAQRGYLFSFSFSSALTYLIHLYLPSSSLQSRTISRDLIDQFPIFPHCSSSSSSSSTGSIRTRLCDNISI